MKDAQPIDTNRPVASQVRVMSLPVTANDGSAAARFEGYYTLLHLGLRPSFDAYTKAGASDGHSLSRTDESRLGGIAGAKKKFAELELNLRQLQDNEDIPVPIFHLHGEIQQLLDSAEKRSVVPAMDLLDP